MKRLTLKEKHQLACEVFPHCTQQNKNILSRFNISLKHLFKGSKAKFFAIKNLK